MSDEYLPAILAGGVLLDDAAVIRNAIGVYSIVQTDALLAAKQNNLGATVDVSGNVSLPNSLTVADNVTADQLSLRTPQGDVVPITVDNDVGIVLQVNGQDLATNASLLSQIATRQPLDADLTAIAALSTTAFGRSLLTQADEATTRTTIGAIGGSLGATANRVLVTSGTGGATAQSCPVTIDGSGNVTFGGTVDFGGQRRVASDFGVFTLDSGNTNDFRDFRGRRYWFGLSGVAIGDASGGVVQINNGTAGTLRDLSLRNLTASGTVNVGGGFNLASRTKAAVLASSPATNAGRFQLSDSGLVGREVYPDGTNWRYASDDSMVT